MFAFSNFVVCIFAVVVSISAESCQKPQVTPKVYTTTDGTVVTNVGFITEFSVACGNNLKNMNLFAEVNGKTFAATKAANGNKYQVSWTIEPKDMKQWNYVVRIYDDDGYAALRKAQRSGEDPSVVQPLFFIDVSHPGMYNGPWFQSEILAAAAAIAVFYFAFTTKMKITA